MSVLGSRRVGIESAPAGFQEAVEWYSARRETVAEVAVDGVDKEALEVAEEAGAYLKFAESYYVQRSERRPAIIAYTDVVKRSEALRKKCEEVRELLGKRHSAAVWSVKILVPPRDNLW